MIAKANTTQRGYGPEHQRARARLVPIIERDGYICARCHRYAPPGSAFHYDHNDARDGYLGASHPHCNLSAAGKKARANDRRKARRFRPW